MNNFTVRNAPAEGIAVLVPGTATGIVRVSLFNVEINNNAGHGVLVNDQDDSTTPPEVNWQPIATGSAAAVEVSVVGSRFIHNGFSVSDSDGLRVNEGGDGDLDITIKYSIFNNNGADGVECDERGMGHVRVEMLATHLTWNGPLDPTDLDDGFDINEDNEGNIQGNIVFSAANDNYEEGFDFNENNAGDLRVNMELVEAKRNGEEGIDYEEDDDDMLASGDLVTVMKGVVTIGNRDGGDGPDGGLKIREEGGWEPGCQTYEHPLDRQLRVRRLRPGELRRERTRQYRMGTGTREQTKLSGSESGPWLRDPRDRHRQHHGHNLEFHLVRERGQRRLRRRVRHGNRHHDADQRQLPQPQRPRRHRRQSPALICRSARSGRRAAVTPAALARAPLAGRRMRLAFRLYPGTYRLARCAHGQETGWRSERSETSGREGRQQA